MSATTPSRKRPLTQLAKEQDVTVIELIAGAIQRHQNVLAAAQSLDVSPGAIHYHLKKNRLHVETRMVSVIVSDAEPGSYEPSFQPATA